MTDKELLNQALEYLEDNQHWVADGERHAYVMEYNAFIDKLKQALAQPEQEPVMILPDGSAFGVMSFPLPDDHWLYAPNEYKDGEYEPIDLPKPILTHALRDAVVAAVRYAVRGATMRGQETDFDPDALVQNAVYALCGPYVTPPQRKPLTDDARGHLVIEHLGPNALLHKPMSVFDAFHMGIDAAEAAHGIKENT